MKRSPEISVIIPCKGHASELRDCLEGLSRMTVYVPYEIIVVDSASDPDVAAVVREYKGVKMVRSEYGLSPGPARNLGVSQARGDFLAFIDADCIPATDWLQNAYDSLLEGMQMVGGSILDAMPDQYISVIDNLLQFAELPPGRPRNRVEVLPACNLAIRREAFEEVNGFPDSLLIQDSLFTERVASHWSENCWFVPEMVVAHRGRNSFNGLYQHHKEFGYFRGLHGFRVTQSQQRIASYRIFIPVIVLKRLVFIYRRVLRWNRANFTRYIILLPIVLYGLLGWASGFYKGCREALENRQKRKKNDD